MPTTINGYLITPSNSSDGRWCVKIDNDFFFFFKKTEAVQFCSNLIPA